MELEFFRAIVRWVRPAGSAGRTTQLMCGVPSPSRNFETQVQAAKRCQLRQLRHRRCHAALRRVVDHKRSECGQLLRQRGNHASTLTCHCSLEV